jgi:replicative DNA helicase
MDNFNFDEQSELLVMPHSLNMEVDVLGCLMSDAENFERIASKLKSDDFYSPKHKVIFDAIQKMSSDKMVIDVVCVRQWLLDNNALSDAGGDDCLNHIVVSSTPYNVNLEVYAAKVKYFAICRELIKTCNDISTSAYQHQGAPLNEILDAAESSIYAIKDSISQQTQSTLPRLVKTVASETLDKIHARTGCGEVTGLTTGFKALDDITLGLHPKELVIVGGVPSMGKTTFAMNIIENTFKAGVDGAGVVFSMEMGDTSIMEKMFSSIGQVNSHNMRKGDMEQHHWNGVTVACFELSKWNLYLDDSSGLTIPEVRARCRRIAKKHGKLSVIMVDYLQLMKPAKKHFSREREVAEISNGLKSLAKEMNCPVIALSQLSRDIGKRPNKRPVMSDLRDSGSIEQDADLIMFVYRDEKYNPDSPDKGMAEIIIAKQRNGETGHVMLSCDLSRSAFRNLENYRSAF